MPSPAALTGSRVEHHRSRQLIRDSRALIASATALIAQSRQAMAWQSYVRIVCAWCQETLRFERSTVTARGLISHSMCFACGVDVFQELDPVSTLSPFSQQVAQCRTWAQH